MSLDQLPELQHNCYVLARKDENENYVFVINSANPVLHMQGPPPMTLKEAENASELLKKQGYKQILIVPYESHGLNAYVNVSHLKVQELTPELIEIGRRFSSKQRK